nr:hypothetical protein [Tanacetum cinerariifolium]
MEQYLAHTDYASWEVILNGNSAVHMTKDEAEGLDKGYDRFQRLLRLLEIHEAETDLKWQVAMLSMGVKQFYKKTGIRLEFNGKEPICFDKTKVKCYNYHRRARNLGNRSRDAGNARYRGRDNGKRPAKEEDENALNLTKLLDSQISAKVKTGLGYDNQFHEKEVLDIREEEVTETVFDNRSNDEENSLANDRFNKGKGYHAVPLPLTGNYMPLKPDLSFAGLDDSIYKFKISKTITSLAKNDKDAPKTSTASVEKPKEDRSSATLIQD